MINENFVIVGAILNIIGSGNYAYNTIKGRTKPNRVTWFLWALAPLIAFSAMLGEGVGLSSLMTFMVGFGPLIVFISSFVNKKSEWKLTRFDMVCGGLSLVGLGLWAATNNPNLAILFSIMADGLALLPTLVKAYKEPETESWLIFMNGALSAAITMLTIKDWSFTSAAFPIYIFTVCVVLFALIRFRLGPKISKSLAHSS